MKTGIPIVALAMFVFIIFCTSSRKTVESEKTTDTKKNEMSICVNMALLGKPIDSIRMDPIFIDSLLITINCLDAYVSYGGGCGETRFNMYYSNIVQNSFPPQTTIYLEFEDDDHCRSIVNKKFSFNLEPFENTAKNGGIWLQLANSTDARIFYESD